MHNIYAKYLFFKPLLMCLNRLTTGSALPEIFNILLELVKLLFLILYHGDKIWIILEMSCPSDSFSTRINIPTKLSHSESFEILCREKLDCYNCQGILNSS